MKRRQLELLRKKLELRKANPLKFYVPHKKQDLFHRAGHFKRRYFRAGNRCGKTTCGVAEDLAWCLGERVWYPQSDPARTAGIPDHPVKGLVIAQDWDKVSELFTNNRGANPGKFWELAPKGAIKSFRRNHAGAIEFFEFENGSSIQFDTVRSFVTNPGGAESSYWHFIHVDEPCPEDMWKAHSRGLIDHNGSAWFLLTPLSEPWIDDMFFPRHANLTGEPITNDEASRWCVQGSIWDNPHLSEDAIATYEADLSPEERECRLNGLPLERVGLIYKQFDYSRHVLANPPWPGSWLDVPANYTIRYAIDPHPRTPHEVLFAATAPTGQVFFFAEIFVQTVIDHLADLIKGVLRGREPQAQICDPIAWIKHPVNDTCMADVFWEHGLFVTKATKALNEGILRTQSALRQPDYLYFADTLQNFLFEIERYVWDVNNPNSPRDRDDHAMECFYRLVLEGLDWVNPAPQPKLEIEDINLNFVELTV